MDLVNLLDVFEMVRHVRGDDRVHLKDTGVQRRLAVTCICVVQEDWPMVCENVLENRRVVVFQSRETGIDLGDWRAVIVHELVREPRMSNVVPDRSHKEC
ncbi:hypothetical protein WICPIJ_009012 [Wickerhamomyces pijperi]|uniref:Uncharacterized protein n=1 Tax=Wickerhamomyces pijperi TaxID=599730 RepID=A0A9P8PTB0_WICPI|nr:hypothetical protein WICPIJ_009012 [Wickerhamomyces pijperi]